jgi:hypothetical protein
VTGSTDAADGQAVHETPAASTPGPLDGLDLPQVFSPAEAAAVLRGAGLREITECALRTRAYRKQVPFHRNGRRIIFTLSDLRDIASGEPHAPERQAQAAAPPAASRPSHRRRLSSRKTVTADAWRARRPGDSQARLKQSASHDARTVEPHAPSHPSDVPARHPGVCRAGTAPSVPRSRWPHGLGT